MIGDVLLITEMHTRAASQIAAVIKQREFTKYVIAIAGESGTGKSEFAHELRARMKQDGYLVKILHGDDYYRILPSVRTEWRKKYGIKSIGESEYDWELLNRNIDDFRKGNESTIPSYDLFTNQKDQLVTNLEKIDILIVEGLFCLRTAADIKVFIDLTYKDKTEAQVIRGKEPQTQFRTEILERESEIIQSHRALADLFIHRNGLVTQAG